MMPGFFIISRRSGTCTDSGEFPDGCAEREAGCKGVLIENSDAELALFALLFEFDGDVRHIRHTGGF